MLGSNRLVRLVAILALGSLALGVCVVALAPGVETVAASAQYSGKVGPLLRKLEDPTTLYDAAGVPYERLGDLDRQPVSLGEVPEILRQAVIATEDQTFYSNDGIDVRSAIRALASNVGAGGIEQGGSTITQQLIKNRYFRNPKRNLDRKIREAVLAHRLTAEWSKNRILEEYLNTVYFGENSYGVKAAAARLIGKPLSELSIADAALLAGLIKNPTAYDPFDAPNVALERRNDVIRRMLGQKVITKQEAVLARSTPLPAIGRPDNELRAKSPYGEAALRQLMTLPELGVNSQERERAIFSGGLRVFTEYDPRLTYIAFNVVNSVIKPSFGPYRAAIAVMDPKDGSVRAVVDGRGTAQGFNLATDGGGRKVGSTFKPITLATAFENGYSPKDSVDGSSGCPVKYDPWGTTPYVGHNAGESSGGYGDLYTQTRNSVNCAFLRLLTSVGPPLVRDMATRLGYTRPVGNHRVIGIGETNHTPLEVATVYSTLADDGIRHMPVFVRRIEDTSGRVLYWAPGGVRVLKYETARTVTDVLSHVTEGTAPRAKLGDRPLAGKTGTVDNQVDAWFAGYTPQLVAAVWMGHPLYEDADVNPVAAMRNVGDIGTVYGGTYPAIIWQKFMTEALKDAPIIPFIKPNESLWPKPARINPVGGRGAPVSDFVATTTTSTPVPVESTPTTLAPVTTTTKAPATTTTTKAPGP
ncbi:MAG: transglycosylase domain-containing protein [Acidimicrobiia bacterium]|nr:transglycosylase domain-containing protein [Acidimicrobiia bacterium]